MNVIKLLGVVILTLSAPALSSCDQAKKLAAGVAGLPSDKNILFWTDAQRSKAFRMMDSLTDAATIEAGGKAMPLPQGKPIDLAWTAAGRDWTIDSYLAEQVSAGVVIVHDGRIRLERYGIDYDAEGRWTSFSVAKSLVSTLVGAAVNDGYIESLDDPVTRYIPALKGSGYDGVSIAQLMTMRSGVKWNEDYGDPQSDVAKFNAQQAEGDIDPVTAYMRKLPSEAKPGTRWQYNTGETNLIGVLVERAAGRPISQYLSEKIWAPYGMEADATWLTNDAGKEIAGCCISARLRDYARFGLFVAEGGLAGGKRVVPEGWFAKAGTKQAEIGAPGRGYGYQWWTYDDGSFAAQGIFGQGIFIDPARKLVIASNGNWPVASDARLREHRDAFYRAVRSAIDREAAPAD
ncbi:MAG: serine hydrolase [Sphingomonadales bacterium]|nr:serine hydrolase [Sphingomonadales bacterium]